MARGSTVYGSSSGEKKNGKQCSKEEMGFY